jgi:AraC-like DNA-binding protein
MTLTKMDVIILHEVKQLIDEKIERPKIPLSQVIQFSGFNKDKLNTAFKILFGESIAHYQIHQRMIRAADLLLTSDLLVKEVAHQVGYHRLHKFTPQFKQYYQCAPTQFRNKFSPTVTLQVEGRE